jgi:hypothetical protein
MDDLQDPYDFETCAMGENIQFRNVEIDSNGFKNQVTPLDIIKTTRILRVELQSYKASNESIIKAREE